MSARTKDKLDLAVILKLLAICPEKAKSLGKTFTIPIDTAKKVTSNEALALLLNENHSKDQYCGVRDQLNDIGKNI